MTTLSELNETRMRLADEVGVTYRKMIRIGLNPKERMIRAQYHQRTVDAWMRAEEAYRAELDSVGTGGLEDILGGDG
jgi:hypothetical protein